jgi:hypothetical protein
MESISTSAESAVAALAKSKKARVWPRGLGLLLFSVSILVADLILTTPIACKLLCDGPEQYPELIFIIFGLPFAIGFLFVSIVRMVYLSRE